MNVMMVVVVMVGMMLVVMLMVGNCGPDCGDGSWEDDR